MADQNTAAQARQIVDQVTYLVASGRLAVGDRLPSVRELARSLPANQNTVLKAYELLEREGLLSRKHGDGTYVAGNGSPLSAAARRRILREILSEAAAKAAMLGIPAQELRRMLEEQIAALPEPTAGTAAPLGRSGDSRQ